MNPIQLQNILVTRLNGTLQGPVVESQERDERSGELFRVLTWEVANGTTFVKEMPLGWLAQIVPMNSSKSKLVLKIARKRTTSAIEDAEYEDGYPVQQSKTVGIEDLTPKEFRSFQTTKTTETKVKLAAVDVYDIPAPASLSGDQEKVTHRKLNDEEYLEEIIETILLDNPPLIGEQFGTWGREETSRALVLDDSETATGFGVKSSSVAPLGNGKSVATSEKWPIYLESLTVAGTLTPAATGTLAIRTETDEPDRIWSTADIGVYPATRLYHDGTAFLLVRHTTASLTPYAVWTSPPVAKDSDPGATTYAPLFGVGIATPTGTPTITSLLSDIVHKLEGQETDELTEIVIDIDKYLVNAASAKAIATSKRVLDYYTEIQPLDKYHSILIASKIADLPTSQTWIETRNINLPDVLMVAGVTWDSSADSDVGTSGVNNISTIEAEGYNWHAAAECGIVGNVTGRPYTLVSNGYKGIAQVTVVRTFHYGPPVDAIAIDIINPVYGVITLHGVSMAINGMSTSNGIGDIEISSASKTKYNRDDKMLIYQFGPIVHGGVSLAETGDDPNLIVGPIIASSGGTPGSGFYPYIETNLNITGIAELQLQASSVPKISGDTYIIHVECKPWRFGVWIKEVYTVTVP